MSELGSMHNPPHPGEVLADVYLDELGLSCRQLAAELDISPSTLSRVLSGSSRVTSEMALRLSKALGTSAQMWLNLQNSYDLWMARQTVDLSRVNRIEREVA